VQSRIQALATRERRSREQVSAMPGPTFGSPTIPTDKLIRYFTTDWKIKQKDVGKGCSLVSP